MAGSGAPRPLRRWTEDCRAHAHHQCGHVGLARTVGLLGARRFVSLCACPCHWGCPAATAELSATQALCTCRANGAERRQDFEVLRRLFDRRS